MYRNILLAADGSIHSIRAAEQAASIASLNSEAIVVIVFVVDQDASKSDVLLYWNEADLGKKRREKLHPIEEILINKGVAYDIQILHGDPGPVIVEFANHNQIDLVAIGSRGLNVFQEFVLGSVSHKVAKRANCPVLIVK